MAWSEIQKAINTNINEALDVLTKRLIGVNTDVSDTTVFGKLNEKVRPYKQLKLNKVTSPICTASNLPKGVMVDYNSQYYLIVSNDKLQKYRWSDNVLVGSVALNGNRTLPKVINDFAFVCPSTASVVCVDLIAMTSKLFNFPTTSTGTIAPWGDRQFDIRFTSGNQYQCLLLADGATKDGTIVCTLDTTANTNTTMAQVSFCETTDVISQNSGCMFGLNSDTNYYRKLDQKIQKVVVSTGIATELLNFPDTVFSLRFVDSMFIASSQTLDYLILQAEMTGGNTEGQPDLIIISKIDGSFSYLGFGYQKSTPSLRVCQIKNNNYCVISNSLKVLVIKNDKTTMEIIKSQATKDVDSFEPSSVYLGNGLKYESVLKYDIDNNKMFLSNGCNYGAVSPLQNVNTYAIREYDIV